MAEPKLILQADYVKNISLYGYLNCNMTYASGLRAYYKKEEQALFDIFSELKDDYSFASFDKIQKSVHFRPPTFGILIFAQGSEDPVARYGYGPNMKALIEREGLGPVVECPALNPSHAFKPAISYMWAIDRDKLKVWWEAYRDNLISKNSKPLDKPLGKPLEQRKMVLK